MTSEEVFVSPYKAGLTSKCPRCGKGALFDGYLRLRSQCDHCGLDYSKADSADGPAVFVIFIVGFIAVAVAFVARYSWYAPAWAAFGISVLVTLVLSLLLLRPLKATLIALQFVNKAEEGRVQK